MRVNVRTDPHTTRYRSVRASLTSLLLPAMVRVVVGGRKKEGWGGDREESGRGEGKVKWGEGIRGMGKLKRGSRVRGNG